MIKRILIAAGAVVVLALGTAAPVSAQGFCNSGPLGGAVCGAGIGGQRGD